MERWYGALTLAHRVLEHSGACAHTAHCHECHTQAHKANRPGCAKTCVSGEEQCIGALAMDRLQCELHKSRRALTLGQPGRCFSEAA